MKGHTYERPASAFLHKLPRVVSFAIKQYVSRDAAFLCNRVFGHCKNIIVKDDLFFGDSSKSSSGHDGLKRQASAMRF